jgi:cytochrome c553
MAQHFASSMALLGTTVIGNPAAFHEAATFLEDREIPANASEAWNLKLEPMRAAAAHATSAKSLEDAARSIGELGAACASCHRALGGPHVDTRRPPPRGSSAKVEAARHAWAAELMWEGLSAPSDEAWTTGARALEQARLEPEVIASAASVDLDVTALSRRAHESGKKGRSAKDDAARAKAVAEAYATCAHCHRRLGVDVTRPRR